MVIATPGRLNDIMEMNKINMTNVMTLALDEADRMLDMGFEPQIRTIIDAMSKKRQTLFFTATWPKEVQRLARDFVQNPVHITVGDAGKLNANKSITQHIHVSFHFCFVLMAVCVTWQSEQTSLYKLGVSVTNKQYFNLENKKHVPRWLKGTPPVQRTVLVRWLCAW